MSTLAELRDLAVELLTEDGITAFDHLPAQVHPPVALLEPADPYLTEAEPALYGITRVRFEVYLVTKRGTGKEQTSKLDALIGTAVTALGEHFEGLEVTRPYQLAVGDARYLATRVLIYTDTTLTTPPPTP